MCERLRIPGITPPWSALLLVGGLGTDAIARRLSISRHTLRDHVKAIFAKGGVGSRPQLTAVFGTESPAQAA